MKRIPLNKTICLLLCLILIAVGLPTSAIQSGVNILAEQEHVADPIVTDQTISENKIESVDVEQLKIKNPDEKTFSELQKMKVDISSLPDFINADNAIKKGHVNRVKSKESNLNTVVYQNTDGTETTYVFMQPVKYIDEYGNVKDKSDKITSITDSTYSYGVLNNNTKIYFPEKSSNGTKIQYKDYLIHMSPVSNLSSSPKYIDENNILYPDVFGTNTSLLYQSNLVGIKEYIILEKNIGKNEFDFVLTTNNLIPTQINNVWYLKNTADETIVSFGNIIINDSAGNIVEGTMNITPTEQKNKYDVKIVVPQEFLSSENTVYPVYVDPSTTVFEKSYYSYYDDNGNYQTIEYNAITDTGLYSTTTGYALAVSISSYHNLGFYSGSEGKVIYKLYDFYGEYGKFKELTSDQIDFVKLYIKVGSGTATKLTVNPMTSTWDKNSYGDDPIAICESTLWDAYSTSISHSLNIGADSREYAINITDIVKGWADYNNNSSTAAYKNPENGFVLKCNLTSSSRGVTAIQQRSSFNNVYYVIDTNPTVGNCYINNVSTGKFLQGNDDLKVNTSKYTTSSKLKWNFEHLGGNRYYIRSLYDTIYVLHGSGKNLNLASLPNIPSNEFIWYVNPASGGGVIIKNAYSGFVLKYDDSKDPKLSLDTEMRPSDDNYKQTVWGIYEVSNYVKLNSFTFSNTDWLSIGSSKSSTLSKYPQNASWSSYNDFYWRSDNDSVATVNDVGKVTGVSNGCARITAIHKSTELAYTIVVTVGQMVSDGKYYIQNVDSSNFVDIDGPSTAEGTLIHQWRYHHDDQAKWILNYVSSGYYTIKSPYSGKYISVKGASNYAGASIEQVTSINSASKWKITKTLSGNYKLTAQCGENQRLSLLVPKNSEVGTYLIHSKYSADKDYCDEWNLYSLDSMFTDGIGISDDSNYFIMNVNTGKYMGLETNSDAPLTNVIISPYANTNMQKWKTEKNNSTGKFQFISSNSASKKVLDVTGNNVDIYTDSNLDCQQFVIQRINWAPYEGTYIIKNGSRYVTADANNNVCMSNNFDDRSVWSIKPATKKDADLYNFKYEGFDTTETESDFKNTFYALGYRTYSLTNWEAKVALNNMTRDSIFIFRGHAGGGRIAFYNNDGKDNGRIYASSNVNTENCGYIGILDDNKLADLRCAIFLGCSTGRTNQYGENLLESTHNKGAHFVLGTLDTTITQNSNAFLTNFLYAVQDNPSISIQGAIIYALNETGENVLWPSYGYTGQYPVVYIGDIYQNFN